MRVWVQRHPHGPECIRTGQNRSERIRIGPSTSENFKKLAETLKNCEKFWKMFGPESSLTTQSGGSMDRASPASSLSSSPLLKGLPSFVILFSAKTAFAMVANAVCDDRKRRLREKYFARKVLRIVVN